MCTMTDKWHPTASTLCPLSLPRRKAQVVSLSYAQNKAQNHYPQRIPLATGGYFECNTYHVTVLGWLKKHSEF